MSFGEQSSQEFPHVGQALGAYSSSPPASSLGPGRLAHTWPTGSFLSWLLKLSGIRQGRPGKNRRKRITAVAADETFPFLWLQ